MNKDVQKIIRNILSDIRVELSDEFDKNFERRFLQRGMAAQEQSATARRFDTDRHGPAEAEHQQPHDGDEHNVLHEPALCSHSQRRWRDKGDEEDEAILGTSIMRRRGRSGARRTASDGTTSAR